jgi:hypothetical protein
LTPAEVDSVAADTITAPVPDAEGTNPQFLILNGRADTIDTSQFSNLHAIVEANNAFTNDALTVTGSHSESIYLGDLNGDLVLTWSCRTQVMITSTAEAETEIPLMHVAAQAKTRSF